MHKLLLIFFSFLLTAQLCGQGKTVKENGHHLATLELYGNFENAKYKIGHQFGSSGINNAGTYGYNKNGIEVSGLVKSAALVMDWWLLFGEPAENYIFKWYATNYYDIKYKSKTGALVTKRIEREKLTKYPDLLKRFDALAPLDIAFKIKWSLGYPSNEDWEAFKKKYGVTGNLGNAVPNSNAEYTSLVNKEFTTSIKSGLLFEASGAEPLAVPGIRLGKGQEFLGLPADYDAKGLNKIFNFWTITSTLSINDFEITKMEWPVGEMKEIADKFDAYEKGEDPTPKEEIAKADEKNKNTTAYNKNDFWGDAVEEEKPSVSISNKKLIIKGNYIEEFLKPNCSRFNTSSSSIDTTIDYNNIVDNSLINTGDNKEGRSTMGSLIEKYKKIVGIFYNSVTSPIQFRIYDYSGMLKFEKTFSRDIYVTYCHFKNTPYVLIVGWEDHGGFGYHDWIAKTSFVLNLTDMSATEIPAVKDYNEFLQVFDLKETGDFYCLHINGKINRKPYLDWYRSYHLDQQIPKEEQYNSLFSKYGTQYKYLFFIYPLYGIAIHTADLYGISNDDKFEKLERINISKN